MTAISPELSQQFLGYDWPGNVRQLENMVKRIVVLGTEAGISKELLQPVFAGRAAALAPPPPAPVDSARGVLSDSRRTAVPAPSPPVADAAASVATPLAADPDDAAASVSLKDIARTAAREAERELILRMLTRTRWNRKEAAEILGVSYKALLYKIKENGLDKAS